MISHSSPIIYVMNTVLERPLQCFLPGFLLVPSSTYVANHLRIMNGLKKKTKLQECEDVHRERRRRCIVQVARDTIQINEHLLGEGEDGRRWIIQGISKVPTALQEEVSIDQKRIKKA